MTRVNGLGTRLVGLTAMALGILLLVRHDRWALWPLLRFPTETDELIFAYLAGIALVVGGYFVQIRRRVHRGVAILGAVYAVFAVICITSIPSSFSVPLQPGGRARCRLRSRQLLLSER